MMDFEDISTQLDWVEMIPNGVVINGLIIYPDEGRYILRSEIFAELTKTKRSRFLYQDDRDTFRFLLDRYHCAGGYVAITGNHASYSYPSTHAYFCARAT